MWDKESIRHAQEGTLYPCLFGLLRIAHSCCCCCCFNQISFQFVSENDFEDCDQNDVGRVVLNKAFNPSFNHNEGNVIVLF